MFTILLVLSSWLIFLFWFGFCLLVLGGTFCSAVLGVCPAAYVDGRDSSQTALGWSRFRSEGCKTAGQQLPALFAALH